MSRFDNVPLLTPGQVQRLEHQSNYAEIAADIARALEYQEDWDSGTAYFANDVVAFDGGKWLALQANTNSEPEEGADWTLFGSAGAGTASIFVDQTAHPFTEVGQVANMIGEDEGEIALADDIAHCDRANRVVAEIVNANRWRGVSIGGKITGLPGGLDPATKLFLDVDGTLTNTPPTASGTVVLEVLQTNGATDGLVTLTVYTVNADPWDGDAETLGGAPLSTDGTMAANSDALVPSQKAVRTYVGTAVTAAIAVIRNGVSSTFDTLKKVEDWINGLGDSITRDIGTTAGTVAAGDDSRFTNSRTPAGAAGGVLSGTYPNPGFASESGSGATVRATSPTIVTPTVASFTNAQHNHQDAAGGGTLLAAAISDFQAAVQALLNTMDVKSGYQYATAAALPPNTYSNGTSGVGATLTATANGPLSVDSILLTAGAKILVRSEADATHNGWYVLTQQGVALVSPYILTRATDADQAAEMGAGFLTPIEGPMGSLGTLNNDTLWLSLGPSPFVVGTSSIAFTQEDASGAMLKANNGSDIPSPSTFRANLGLAALALLATVGTAQIDADAVTYAKIQNVSAADRLLGRATAGAGDVEEIACTAAGRALLDDASATVQRATMGAMSSERRIITMTGDTTLTSDDMKVRLIVLRAGGGLSADDVLTLPNEEFFTFVTNETGVDITVTRATGGVTDSLPPEPDVTATRLYKWIP